MKILLTLLLTTCISLSSHAAEKSKKSEDKAEEPSAKVLAIAKTLTPTQKTKLMDIINKGDEKVLMSLPGIGEVRAAAIKKARPVEEPADLVKIEGIGEATFADIVAHAKAGFPQPESSDSSSTKSKSSKDGGKTKTKSPSSKSKTESSKKKKSEE